MSRGMTIRGENTGSCCACIGGYGEWGERGSTVLTVPVVLRDLATDKSAGSRETAGSAANGGHR